jgi:hypothetical protein
MSPFFGGGAASSLGRTFECDINVVLRRSPLQRQALAGSFLQAALHGSTSDSCSDKVTFLG